MTTKIDLKTERTENENSFLKFHLFNCLFRQALEAACIRNVPASSSASSHPSRSLGQPQEVELPWVPA